MFLPLVMGSDKTTVSVATGNQEFHPFYGSPGIISGIAQRSHGSGVLPYAMLPIPKGLYMFSLRPSKCILTDFLLLVAKRHRDTPAFKKFARQLYHECLAFTLSPLKDGMTTPVIMRCPCGFYRRVIYGLGPYIADYPEQVVWLACVVQGWCPKYALISFPLLVYSMAHSFSFRCEAMPKNLDDLTARLRSHQRTEFIFKCFDPGTTWDEYGIRSDVVVRAYCLVLC
jgi:hypothetical protein